MVVFLVVPWAAMLLVPTTPAVLVSTPVCIPAATLKTTAALNPAASTPLKPAASLKPPASAALKTTAALETTASTPLKPAGATLGRRRVKALEHAICSRGGASGCLLIIAVHTIVRCEAAVVVKVTRSVAKATVIMEAVASTCVVAG